MEYMTAAEAAEKWGIKIRSVQRLAAAGRIIGAKKHMRDYLIPAGAEKPVDPRIARKERGEPYHINRNKPQKALPQELSDVLAATWISSPRDNPAAILVGMEERLRVVLENAFCYSIGNFEPIKSRFLSIEGDAVKLAAASIAITAAIEMGDYPFFLSIENWLKSIVASDIRADVTAFAELTLAGAYLGAGVPGMAPGWLKTGDFSALPDRAKRNAAYMRVQYFRWLGNHEVTLAVAQTTLALCADDGLTFEESNLRLMCAAACCALGREQDAERYLLAAMDKHLSAGCIIIFAEYIALFSGLLERLIQRDYPAYYEPVINLNKRIFHNWLSFHNRFAMDNITLILPLGEYEMALFAARGNSDKKIAEKFGFAAGTVKNKMDRVYEKLGISGGNRKKELAKIIL